MTTLLGFDYGPKKIGVAIGQTVTGTASPLKTIRSIKDKPNWNAIVDLVTSWQPDAIIVGLPYNMDDTEADLARQTRRFARQLEGRFQRRVYLIDERLTSFEARQRKQSPLKNVEELDAIAAKLIVETWLSEQR